ncbi:ABC transporter permease [Amycolatopsis sp. MJM2582]|uniref:EamA family transporter n=1 Tax=Amycolatopsis sp. MJM2582 TaxID=1427749 RepID=UPI0005030E80|nr:EamA family transporter [Amycolatopsis sp. MJM2582]KFZ77361.1 ABC transporter permease [Amycolatopsis sp. MJM2582]
MAIIAERPVVPAEPAAAKPTLRDAGLAALAPASWGTVYVVTATLLPPDRPLLAAALRALPAGLLLLALTRRLPHGSWWWKTTVLGMLNFGAFLPLIFFAAYRLPGGVAATLGALQPLLVALLALPMLRVRTPAPILLAAIAGAGGVALLTLSSEARLDPLGLAAMLTAVALMAVSLILTKKWGRPEYPLAMTGWQLTLGGIVLAPATLLFEGLPSSLTTANLIGYGYIGIVTTALAYPLWFRGIDRLAPASVSLLTLTNPLVATAAGFLVLDQTLTGWQLTGFAVALTALTLSQTLARPGRAGAR